MIDLEELSQLVAFADSGTLSRVAEEFHISTPSVTRAMQHLEDTFAVPLFIRGKNKIELSETGKKAVEEARKLLRDADRAMQEVREFDARQRTIVISSCAPAPLWELQKRLNLQKPGMRISSSIGQNSEVQSAWQEGACDIAVLPFPADGAKLLMQENLYVCVPKNHELARNSTLTFADINGFNFLLRTELGFWDALCREKMPASKFLVQPDPEVFEELVRESSLPSFTTDYGEVREGMQGNDPERVNIPLTDREAHVTFYVLSRCHERIVK